MDAEALTAHYRLVRVRGRSTTSFTACSTWITRPRRFTGCWPACRPASARKAFHPACATSGSSPPITTTSWSASLVPVRLTAHLRKSHFLSLGYSLRDWNLRVILHRIWGGQKLTYKSWAIQFDPIPVDQEFWSRSEVDILELRLEDYLVAIARDAGSR